MKPLRTVIIDDEPVARQGIESYVNRTPTLLFCGMFDNPIQFLESGRYEETDLLLLDIEMPGLKGTTFLQRYKLNIPVVFITAYQEYALEGYQLDVIDYLLKPVTYSRFLEAINKVWSFHSRAERKEEEVWVKTGSKLEKVILDDIFYIQSMQNYVRIHSSRKTYTIHMPLKEMAEKLPGDTFIQCHKSYIINMTRVDRIEGHTIYIDKEAIPVSRNLKEEVVKRLTGGKWL